MKSVTARTMLVLILLLAGGSAVLAEETACKGTPAKRPNFVWLTSEDNSVHYMDLYFKTGASTPGLQKLAKDGVVFNHAFSVTATDRSINGPNGNESKRPTRRNPGSRESLM